MHNAPRHLRSLRLSLGQDKAPIGLLLAAGCGVAVRSGGSPLVPDIAGMTAALKDELSSGVHTARFTRLLAVLGEDGVTDPNIEDWLTLVRALTLVAKGGPARELTLDDLDQLEAGITDGIVRLVEKDLPGTSTPFHDVAAWAGALERDLPVEIFTTNYDLLLEQAFESRRSPFFDGFVGVREPFFDNASISASNDKPLPARFTRLWKLHGSINWYLTTDGDVIRTGRGAGGRRLIHPSHLKYDESRQMPYLALLDRLRSFLAQRGALLVACGYSFRDRHINSVIAEALQANPTASVVGLLYGTLVPYTSAIALAESHANFGLYAEDEGIIGTRRGPWEGNKDELSSVTGLAGTAPDDVQVTVGNFVTLGSFLAGLLDRTDTSS
jgi:hypothetical protein